MGEGQDLVVDLGSISFTPAWARKEAGVNVGKVRPEKDRRDSQGREGRPRDAMPGGAGGARKFQKKPSAPRQAPRMERPRPLDAEVKILPETKALGTIMRKIQSDFHAYKLKDIAYFFLDNPQSVLLKISPRRPAGGDGAQTEFFQCKACGFASTNQSDVAEHVVSAHLCDYYDAREIEVEPPAGNFSCVAKCGLSGELLGPPNIHEFASTVKEMVRTRYPDMTEEQYRSHIEMVRDPDEIERWRKSAVKRTVFVRKGAEGDDAQAGMSREAAEGEFRRTILASLLDSPKNLMITADAALNSPVKPLQWAVKNALEAERASPFAMCFALRGAFHHRKFKFFRANDARGPEFVTSVEYREFDAAHAIPELAAVAKFVAENPCCDKSELPGGEESAKHLAWLASTGHVVAFTNGVFSQVEKFPKYGPMWKKRRPAAAPAEGNAEPREEKKDETASELA